MPAAFQYKPRFVDIRVRPPSKEEDARAEDVTALKPGERACDHPGCRLAATARAPKSRDMLNEHYWFCQQEELFTGGRPTWEMKAGRMSREAAAFSNKFRKGEGYRDPFNLFGKNGGKPMPEAEGRHLGKIERNALADLDLDANADGPRIRTRYTELVRRLHPDANGGDRAGENRLQRVIKAYQSL